MVIVLYFVGAMAAACLLAFGCASIYIKRQGDSRIVLETEFLEVPRSAANTTLTLSAKLGFKNEGTQDAVLLDVRVSAPRVPGVLVEPSIVREGTRPTELGYWVANILEPGESCNGDLTVQISAASPDALSRLKDLGVSVSFDEVGRSLLITKTQKIGIIVPAMTRTGEEK